MIVRILITTGLLLTISPIYSQELDNDLQEIPASDEISNTLEKNAEDSAKKEKKKLKKKVLEKSERKDDAKAETKKVTASKRSKISKFLQNRLYLTSALGFGTITGSSSGTWATSRLNTVLEIGISAWSIKRLGRVNTVFSYAPHDVFVRKGLEQYEGVVEIYSIGAHLELDRTSLTKNLKKKKNLDQSRNIDPQTTLIAGAELGLAKTSLKALSNTEVESSLGSNGVFFNLVGGTRTQVMEKTFLGAQLSYGFGKIQLATLKGTFTFYF